MGIIQKAGKGVEINQQPPHPRVGRLGRDGRFLHRDGLHQPALGKSVVHGHGSFGSSFLGSSFFFSQPSNTIVAPSAFISRGIKSSFVVSIRFTLFSPSRNSSGPRRSS